MTLDQAGRKIRAAWIAGLISASATLIVTLAAISQGGTFNLQGTTISTGNFLDVFLILLLTFGIYMKSRVAAIGMLIYFLISKLIMFTLAAGFNVVAAVFAIVFLYFYFEGTRGTIMYHRLRQSGNQANPPAIQPEN
ncbi:MAG TPA: hypothetical protein VFO16_21090 [Pseudonocardiaceae bacterium]|nr:hypothetical protein [Pseudonocardiaceae bacterium]